MLPDNNYIEVGRSSVAGGININETTKGLADGRRSKDNGQKYVYWNN
jgi:hypothetical protein